MPLLLQLSLIAVFVVVAAAKGDMTFYSGEIEFYRDVNLRNKIGTLGVFTSNRCVNLDCDELNDAVSSVKWSGLPTVATYEGGKNVQIVFYTDSDCNGKSDRYPTKWGGILSFSALSFNRVASSFMILEYSTGIEDGYETICRYRESGNFQTANASNWTKA